jgi:hypothetical protein
LICSSRDSKFLFLTNAQVSSKLLPFVISQIGEDSNAVAIPQGTSASDSPEIARRIGIRGWGRAELIYQNSLTMIQNRGFNYL